MVLSQLKMWKKKWQNTEWMKKTMLVITLKIHLDSFIVFTLRYFNFLSTSLNIKNTEELYKKDLHGPDDHDGMLTHLEPDILECKVKWALGNITMNKAGRGDGIPVELFQILKNDAVKVLYSTCQQIWKTQQWPQDWKRSVFIPISKKGSVKECSNYWTIALISCASK